MRSGKKSRIRSQSKEQIDQKNKPKDSNKQQKKRVYKKKGQAKIGDIITTEDVNDSKQQNQQIDTSQIQIEQSQIDDKIINSLENPMSQITSTFVNFPSLLRDESQAQKSIPPIQSHDNQIVFGSQEILSRMITKNQIQEKETQKHFEGREQSKQCKEGSNGNDKQGQVTEMSYNKEGANQSELEAKEESQNSNLSLNKKRSIKINEFDSREKAQMQKGDSRGKNQAEFNLQNDQNDSKKQGKINDFCLQKGTLNGEKSWEKKENAPRGNFSLLDSLVVRKPGRYSDEYDDAKKDCSQKDGKKLIMLGRGGFGQVFLVQQKGGACEERAMKIVLKSYQEAYREVMMLKKFSHPNVLKIYEYFEDEQSIYVITERCYGYNLFDYIILKGQFSEKETCKIADGVLRALSEAHKQGIVHRDVKPENIMLDFNSARDSFIVKLIDWGLADQIPQGENKYLTKRCGTLHYLAPEVLKKKYNEKVDLWSLGMVLFTLIQGSPPICGKSQLEILEKVQEFTCQFVYSCWKNVSNDAKDLILKLMERDPSKRISSSEALRHPWFNTLNGTVQINSQDLQLSYNNLLKYAQQNTFKKTVLGFFASHTISKRERTKYIEIFQALDTDKNGELSIEELQSGFSKLFGNEEYNVCQTDIEQIFYQSLSSRFENADGIKYEEFLSSMLACSATYSKEQLFDAFKLFDKDGNGKITLQEIIDTLGISENKELVEIFEQIIEQFDTNQDGQIDFEEFSQIMTNFIDNHSQVILQQEIYFQ